MSGFPNLPSEERLHYVFFTFPSTHFFSVPSKTLCHIQTDWQRKHEGADLVHT